MKNCKHCKKKRTHSDSEGATSCKNCPLLTYQDQNEQTLCKLWLIAFSVEFTSC